MSSVSIPDVSEILEKPDPRREPDFDPAHFPTADGSPPPPASSMERNDRITLEFCVVYYRLNRLHARLREARSFAPGPQTAEVEREIMKQIEVHLCHRDQLEDCYAPYGVIAEAQARDGFTVNIQFTFGDRNILREQRTKLISSTALVFFDRPPRIAQKEDSGSHEGSCPTTP